MISMAVVLVGLVCAAAAILLHEVAQYGRSQTQAQLLSTTRALGLVIDGELERFEGILQALADKRYIDEADWAHFDARARKLLADPDAWIVVGQRDGQQLVNTRLPQGAALPHASYPRQIWSVLDQGKSRTCDLTRGVVVNHILCVDVPVVRDGRAKYVISVIFKPRFLRSVLDRQHLSAGTFGTILDQNGRVVWRNADPERFIGDLATADLRADIAARGEGIRESTALSGEATLAAFSKSPRSGWTFVVAAPRDQVTAAATRALYLGLLSAVVLLLIGGAIGLLVARRVTEAVNHLCEAALRIRDGDAPRYEASGLREIDAVGAVLDEAVAARDLHEERFNLAQEVGGIGAWDWDVPEDQGHVSDSYKAMHGLDHVAGPLSIAQVRQTIHPGDRKAYEESLIAARGRREASTHEYRVVHPDGSVRWIASKGRPIFDAHGRCVRAVGIVRDATAERSAGQLLQETVDRLALATEAAQIGIWDLDIRRGTLTHSEEARIIFGLPEGHPRVIEDVLAVMHPDDRPVVEEQMARALSPAVQDTAPFEYRVVHANGAERWVLVHGRAVFEGGGIDAAAVRYTGTVLDITERKRAEQELNRLNALLRNNVDERTAERDRLWTISHDPFVVANSEGRWLAASPAWTTLLGWSEEELVGRTSEWMEHPDDRALTAGENQRLASGQVTTNFINRFRAKDGSYRWLSWTAVPEGDRFYSIARDITGERERAEALRKAEEALRQSQKMESIGQITGGLAHDFNNLLTPIVGALDLLQQRGLPDPRSGRLVGGAIEAADRARMLVQRLLAFARRQPLQIGAVDVVVLTQSLRGLIETTVGSRIDVDFEHPLAPLWGKADANQLEMALLNLAVNARDAMPDGGKLSVRVAMLETSGDTHGELEPGRYVSIVVEDTGMGMPASVLERATEPFFSTKGSGRGTGLGLSMVHGLAAQLGGTIRITSQLGAGTLVQIVIPAADPPSSQQETATREMLEPAGRSTVLLVDDEALVRASTADMLASLGFAVVEASSAAQAEHILDDQPGIDLLVTDHLMPEMTGTELARKAKLRRPDLPILIVSGYSDVDDIAPDFPRLLKPFRTDELRRSIAALRAGVAS
ncbi:PAS domain-containing protein [Sphingomonas jeddahensis]|uniref:histidine kinase n=1 Tax=Sphingomonas jeddahensis TaxID=1915074 RepID=A0A1V2EYE9_9SPHN|nr:PAS domain-containing protein [Sphingomonas jeddahensis]ONF97308.1 Blue-light-activated protein [Sphingomonas jeddahensis]